MDGSAPATTGGPFLPDGPGQRLIGGTEVDAARGGASGNPVPFASQTSISSSLNSRQALAMGIPPAQNFFAPSPDPGPSTAMVAPELTTAVGETLVGRVVGAAASVEASSPHAAANSDSRSGRETARIRRRKVMWFMGRNLGKPGARQTPVR